MSFSKQGAELATMPCSIPGNTRSRALGKVRAASSAKLGGAEDLPLLAVTEGELNLRRVRKHHVGPVRKGATVYGQNPAGIGPDGCLAADHASCSP